MMMTTKKPERTCSRCGLTMTAELNNEPLCEAHFNEALAAVGDSMRKLRGELANRS